MAETPETDFSPKLNKPAQRALAGVGYIRLAQLTTVREADLARLHGMGPKALGQLREALAAGESRSGNDPCPSPARGGAGAHGWVERRFTVDERTRDDAGIDPARGRYDRQGDVMTEVLDPQQEAMMEAAKPTPEHEWLQRLVGEWTYEMNHEEPGKPPVTVRGTGVTRAVGELWTISDGEGEMPDGDRAQMVTTLGYDPQKGKFVGTWLGSMMSYLWVYEGFLDADRRVLTLESVGPSMTKPGELSNYRDIITVIDEDYHTMTGNFVGDDGAWHEMTLMHFRRKK